MISPRERMLGLRATAAQGIAVCTSLDVARWPMWASSAGPTAGCAAGSSRNHHQKPAAQAAPTPPNAANVQRQPMAWISSGREERGQGAADRRGRQQHPLSPAALLIREPSREHAGHVREGPRLAGAEEEPHADERPQARARPGHRGEGRPPERDPRQHPPRADPISPSARRDLEQPVRQRERHQDVAALRVRQPQVGLDGIDGRGHADPIEIQDPRQQAEQAQHHEAGTRRARTVRFDRLPERRGQGSVMDESHRERGRRGREPRRSRRIGRRRDRRSPGAMVDYPRRPPARIHPRPEHPHADRLRER